jgi:V-type H+-transporting ATPase subunit a
VEYHHLLIKARKFLDSHTDIVNEEYEENGYRDSSGGVSLSPLLQADPERGLYQSDEMSFSNIAGVIATNDKGRFERMLFRATRGNSYVRFSPLSSKAVDAFGNHIDKICFIIFYKSSSIESKIRRICDAFSANRYDLSNLNRLNELEAQQKENHRELVEEKQVLDKNNETRMRLCIDVAECVEEWLWVVRREKSSYHTLNLFKSDVAGNSVLRGRGWVLTGSISEARAVIKRAHINMNLAPTALLDTVPEKWPTAPTHFITNKFTVAFQSFVNTYGIARYKEINPALFTAASFPFLFGVMYGDIGHGSCLMLAGLYLIFTESQAEARSTPEMLKEIYVGRYMLFAMGLMGIYAGLVYNDYFSLGLDLFGSNYKYDKREVGTEAVMLSPYGDASNVYPFGVDPAWKISGNELLFYNSMKMKLSVIIGISQMTFGICLRGINSMYYGEWLDFFTEFLPMIVFDVSFFGYMVVLIFVKWSINWNDRMAMGSCSYDADHVLGGCNLSDSSECYSYTGAKCDASTLVVDMCPLDYGGSGDGCQPPNLITTLINIALKPGSVDEPMFANQGTIQLIILLIAFICIPTLLLYKPFYLKRQNNLKTQRQNLSDHDVVDALIPGNIVVLDHDPNAVHGHGDHFDFSEIFIHQAIETIEFVLGMVSNTASYLRLWALSLAHTELATVFWEKAMVSMIETNNPVLIFMGYAVFAMVTFGVLLAMDVLECFLHALRLHWVEFQNKFFKADGYSFVPFEFKVILGNAQLE